MYTAATGVENYGFRNVMAGLLRAVLKHQRVAPRSLMGAVDANVISVRQAPH
jgi:hypothetical protein